MVWHPPVAEMPAHSTPGLCIASYPVTMSILIFVTLNYTGLDPLITHWAGPS